MWNVIRKTILVAVLMLAASAFAYEHFVIRRQPVRIQSELMDLVNDTSHNYSEEEIAALVDRPSELVFESRQKRIVKFSWRGVSPRSYDLYVVFRNFRGSTLMSDVSLTEPSVNKPFIDANNVADSNGESGQASEVRAGETPTNAAGTGGRRGLVEGG